MTDRRRIALGGDLADGGRDEPLAINQEFHPQSYANPRQHEQVAAESGSTEMSDRDIGDAAAAL